MTWGGIATSACGQQTKFVAPEIDPPTDLIPGYVPQGYQLEFGFQLPGEKLALNVFDGDGGSSVVKRIRLFDPKTPNGNDIRGVYYRGKDHLILITKSHFPEASLDLWSEAYEESQLKPCECDCNMLRLEVIPAVDRLYELLEERELDGTRIAILKGPGGGERPDHRPGAGRR